MKTCSSRLIFKITGCSQYNRRPGAVRVIGMEEEEEEGQPL
jgi:hypothetical protein